jgi:hypothetical protein
MHEERPAEPGEWRKSYAHVFQLPALGCAWEFVRRNAKLEAAWSALKPAWQESVADHGLKIVHAPPDMASSSSSWLWASSFDDATQASVIWDPASTAHVLKVVALPPRMALGGQVLDLEFLTTEKTLFVTADGQQQLLLRDGTRSLQLDIRGAPITEPVALFADTAVPENRPDAHLALLRCFSALRLTGDLPKDCLAPHPYAKRAALVLVALDGYLAGVAHRDIAVAMYGLERVDRDWSDPGEHLRDGVRRAIARGVALMEGGYRIFLR